MIDYQKQLQQCRESYQKLLASYKRLKDQRSISPKPSVKKTSISHPRWKGGKTAGMAAGVWMVLNKTGWITRFVEPGFLLPVGFFNDTEIAGYCTIGLAWLIRELYQSLGAKPPEE